MFFFNGRELLPNHEGLFQDLIVYDFLSKHIPKAMMHGKTMNAKFNPHLRVFGLPQKAQKVIQIIVLQSSPPGNVQRPGRLCLADFVSPDCMVPGSFQLILV